MKPLYRMLEDGETIWQGRAHDATEAEEKAFYDEPPGGLCSIGSIFSPGCTSPPESDEEPERWPYVAVNNYFARKLDRPEQILF